MGQRKKVRPGDPGFRQGTLGEYWLEWGEGQVLEVAQPPGRRDPIATRPAEPGKRNAMLVIKPGHLEHPMALTVDTHDRALPLVVKLDPCALIGHVIGYRTIVRRTQAFVRAAPGNLHVPIEDVKGSSDGTRFKVRELIDVLEIDEQDPTAFNWTPPMHTGGPVVEADPATWPEPSLEAIEDMHPQTNFDPVFDRMIERQHASFGLIPEPLAIVAKVHALRVADRSLKTILDRAAPEHYRLENFEAWRSLTFSVVGRVLRQIEGDFEQQNEALICACDLTEGALLLYSRSWPFPLTDERCAEYERLLTDTATSAYRQVSGWRIH